MNKKFLIVTGLLCASACLLDRPLPPRAEVRPVAGRSASAHLQDAALEQSVRSALGSMPLRFEENVEPADGHSRFVARGGNFLVALAPGEAAVMMHTSRAHEKRPAQLQPQGVSWGEALAASSVVRVEFSGARQDARLTGLEPQSGTINYFKGNDAQSWRRNVPHYSRVRDEEIYPGIDAIFYGDRRQLEYDFVVKPGADPSAIRMRVEGAASVELTKEGGVVARTPAGALSLLPPRLYQQDPGQDRGPEVAGRYVWRAPNEIGFEVANYDRTQTLVIDPPVNVARGILASPPPGPPPPATPPTGDAVALSTFLSGTNDDSIQSIAIGSTGMVYVSGWTTSSDFLQPGGAPLPGGPFQPSFQGFFDCSLSPQPEPCGDAFVAEINVATITSPALVAVTYLGGAGDDVAWGMALDATNRPYLVGETNSSNFPTAGTPVQAAVDHAACVANGQQRPCRHAFFSVMSNDLKNLVYSTYLGGTDNDAGYAVTVNTAGQAFLTGVAGANFLATTGVTQGTYMGAGDVFVAEIDPASVTGLPVYATYIGGSGTDAGLAIALDNAGQAVVGGITYSTNDTVMALYPTAGTPLVTPLDRNACGPGGGFTCGDGFVSIVNATGSALVYSTFLGGSFSDQINGLAVDANNNVYLTGQTNSTDFPTAGTPPHATLNNSTDAFVAKLQPNGPLTYSTFLGGSNTDMGEAIAIDGAGDAFISGTTFSADFPTAGNTLNALQAASPTAALTSFVAVLNAAGTSFLFATYYGGNLDFFKNPSQDLGNAIALDSTGRIYLGGRTTSVDICTINPLAGEGAHSANFANFDAFLTIINPSNTPAACFQPDITGGFQFAATLIGKRSGSQGPLIINQGSAALNNAISFTGANPTDFPVTTACPTVAAGGASCLLQVAFAPKTGTAESATLVLTNNSAGSPFMINLQGQGLPLATATLLGPGNSSPLAFGSVTLNATSTLVATLTNTSAASPLDVTSAALTGAPPSPDITIAMDSCSGTTVMPGSACMIKIAFTPKSLGAALATTLMVTDDGAGGSQTLSITGTGVAAPPVITLPTLGLTFAAQGQGTTSPAQSVTITNTAAAGAANLMITQPLTFTGTNPGDFGASGCAAAVAPGGNCTIMVTFTPTGAGARSGTLQIASNAANGTQTIGVSGTGLAAPTATPAPSPLNFTTPQVVNTMSAPMNVTLSNTGGSTLSITSIMLTGGNMADFAVATNGCGTSLGAGGSCVVAITFTPSATGARTTMLQFTDALGTQNVTINGTGATGPAAALTPPTITFVAPQQINTMSGTMPATLTNSGGAALAITNIATTGDFSAVSSTCGNSLAANSACAINVAFTPTAPGTRNGTLTVMDAVGTQMINLTGTGVTPPAVMLSTTSLTFGTQAVGVTTGAMSVMLTNTGGSTLNISSLAASGDFAESDNCVPSVAAGGNCMIMVTFTPTGAGNRNGAISINDNAAGSPQIIMLTGTGSTNVPGFNLSAPLFFGAVLQGSTSAPQVVTITNSGGAPLTVAGASASGDFGAVSGCTAALTTGQNCMISVTFTPTATGTRNGTLTIMDNAPGNPHTVALSGLGATFSLAPPAGAPTSLTINPGDTANFPVSFSSTPGLVLPVMLSCNSNAPFTICTVNPSSVALGGPTPPTVTVTLQTNCIGQLVGPQGPANGPTTGLPAPIGAVWAAVLLLFALARRSRDARAAGRWAARLVPVCAALALVLMMAGLAACVSNNPPAIPGAPTTPAGTFNVTVTANGQNITKLLNLVVRVI